MLIQKRSEEKSTWPGYWDGTVAGHPRVLGPEQYEQYEEAGKRRLKEELGISAELKKVFTFVYHERCGGYAEWENCALLVGYSDDSPIRNPDEVSDVSHVYLDVLRKGIDKNPEKYTPWFRIAFDKFWNG